MPYMAATLFAPLARNPHRAPMRGMCVMTMYPDIPVSVPTMEPWHPYITGPWRRYHLNWSWRRGADAYDDLGVRRPDRQK
jgi:hypothetical protein